MTYKTKGIVLRSVKYGETSLVLTIFTELFGVQAYIVNGVRTSKRSGAKAAMYQPAAILEMDVYHNELRSMHRIKECSWAFLYNEVLTDVVKNSIALFMVELLYKTLKQPEQHTDLFYFCEDALKELDKAPAPVAANFALYFALHLTHFFGFRISNAGESEAASADLYLDLLEGFFTSEQPAHPHFIAGEYAMITAELLKIMQPHELSQLKLNHVKRRELLLRFQEYYALHIADFGQMKTLAVLHEVLG
jgi:DNA repair protein RecO (recombination protein O)